jgi:uncharacterized protein YbjT (DUF2867 family)
MEPHQVSRGPDDQTRVRALVFGANGMVGSGVLLECLEDPRVESVLEIGRRSSGRKHPKLRELVHRDLFDLSAVAEELRGYDACFYCLGVSSAGLSEEEYRRVTYGLTVAVVDVLVQENPDLTICFVSGQGTDGSGSGRAMWARVKGEAENYLLALPQEAYMFRPGYIQPMKGVRSRTRLYHAVYTVVGPLYPVFKRLFPGGVTTTVAVGKAMINAVTLGASKRILETRDINELAAAG